MLSGATTAWADSGLYLFGMEVPSTSNWSYDAYNNLNGAILNGTVSYDAATKTVTFDYIQAVVSDDTRILYNKNVPGLKIVFNSWGTLQSNYCVFRLDCNTEIQGPNSDDDLVILDARGNNSQCIYCPNETNLTIKDFGKLKMTSKYRAMHTKGTWVNVYNSNIYAQGDDCAVQNDMGNYDEFRGNLRLHNCILRDSWAMLMGSIGEGCTDYHAGGPYVFHVHTSKAKSAMIIREEDYIGVRLKGIALTKGWSVNEDTSNPSYGIEDYYTYDESTKTLTLKKDFRAKTGYGDDKKGNLADWVGISVNTPITINGDGHYVYGQRGLSCNDDATLNNIIVAGTEDGIYITGSKLPGLSRGIQQDTTAVPVTIYHIHIRMGCEQNRHRLCNISDGKRIHMRAGVPNPHLGASSGSRPKRDPSSGRLHSIVKQRKAVPSPSGFPGRKPRLQSPPKRFGIHPRSIVFHRQTEQTLRPVRLQRDQNVTGPCRNGVFRQIKNMQRQFFHSNPSIWSRRPIPVSLKDPYTSRKLQRRFRVSDGRTHRH